MRTVIYLVHLNLHEHDHFDMCMMSFYKLKKQTMIMLLCDAKYSIVSHGAMETEDDKDASYMYPV